MKCEIHKEEMVPVSWMKRNGIAYSTAYACRSCIKKANARKEPIRIFEGPVDHSVDDDDYQQSFLIKIIGKLRELGKDKAAERGEKILSDFYSFSKQWVHLAKNNELYFQGEKVNG